LVCYRRIFFRAPHYSAPGTRPIGIDHDQTSAAAHRSERPLDARIYTRVLALYPLRPDPVYQDSDAIRASGRLKNAFDANVDHLIKPRTQYSGIFGAMPNHRSYNLPYELFIRFDLDNQQHYWISLRQN
jgi:hypothetical protein